jgi:hypothetical protein
MKDEEEPPNLYEELERRALFDLPEDDDEPRPPDVIGALTGATDETLARDVTLGGYIEKHDRVPAFEGSDGQPYTVDIDVVAGDDVEPRHAAFLLFIRWAATGAGIMDHVESGDIAFGATEQEARQAALELSLYEVKAELDAAIARRREALGD